MVLMGQQATVFLRAKASAESHPGVLGRIEPHIEMTW